jgi:hypothetical protein
VASGLCSICCCSRKKKIKSETGLAAKYPGDKGIEKNPAVIFASGFEEGFDGWTEYKENISVIVKDPDIVHSGSACLQSTATRGKDTGGDVVFRFPRPVDQLYLRFYCRFHKDTVMPHHFVKLRAIPRGFWPNAGRRPPGDKAFWTGIEPTSKRTWHFYTYWHKMNSWQNWGGMPNNPPDGDGRSFYGNSFTPDDQKPFEREQWICVEAMIKANTPGKLDGEQAFWIDGQKIGHWKPGSPVGTWAKDKFVTSGPSNKDPKPFEGFDFRLVDSVKLNQFSLQWYISERVAEGGEAVKNSVYFDDVVVATEYIGPRVEE